jgi:hypothetical protein
MCVHNIPSSITCFSSTSHFTAKNGLRKANFNGIELALIVQLSTDAGIQAKILLLIRALGIIAGWRILRL